MKLRRLFGWLLKPSCRVYIACKMSGRDRTEQIRRAHYVCEVLRMHGLDPISPVVEENVKNEPGKLVNYDKAKLQGFWKRDKEIIRREAHVVLLDHAEMKSFGMEREYGLNRYCLWKPTYILVPQGTPLSVAEFEDDKVFTSVNAAGELIAKKHGSKLKRWIWRLAMLNHSLPGWLVDQVYAWR